MPQTNEMHEMRELTPKITRNLYRKTLRALRVRQHSFCEAANAAIDSEIAIHGHAKHSKKDRWDAIHSIGSMLMSRHPQLIV